MSDFTSSNWASTLLARYYRGAEAGKKSTRIFCPIVAALLCAGCATGRITATATSNAGADSSATRYVDRSPHIQRFVVTDDRTRIHVLDWGGRGGVILLVPGYGLNAHVYDDFAPQLTDKHRVLAITLRGWAPSGAPPSGYTNTAVATDIVTVLDSLHIRKAILVGHSFGGDIITRTAVLHPDRVRALVYLEGALQGAARDSAFNQRPFMRPPSAPAATDTTFESRLSAYRSYMRRYFFGTWTSALEAEHRAHYTGQSDELQELRATRVARFGVEDPADAKQADFSRVSQPSLSVCALASPRTLYPWLTPDSARWHVGQTYVDDILNPFLHRECDMFRQEAPQGQTVLITSNHYIFIVREAAVLRAMRTFLAEHGL